MPSFDSDWMMGLKGIFIYWMMYYSYNQKNEIKQNIISKTSGLTALYLLLSG